MKTAFLTLAAAAAVALATMTAQASPQREPLNISFDRVAPPAASLGDRSRDAPMQLVDRRYHRRHYGHHHGHYHHGHGYYHPHHGHYDHYDYHHGYHGPHFYYHYPRYHYYHGYRGGIGVSGPGFHFDIGF